MVMHFLYAVSCGYGYIYESSKLIFWLFKIPTLCEANYLGEFLPSNMIKAFFRYIEVTPFQHFLNFLKQFWVHLDRESIYLDGLTTSN